MKGFVTISESTAQEKFPSGYYRVGNDYCYISGVYFNMRGYME
ncbi:MAG: hypothetical protein ACI4J4_07650 [Ruminiclostridium sp.]